MRRRILILLPLVLAAGCGSRAELPPAPEPAVSPPPHSRPAGRVIALGHKPEGLALDDRTGLLAAGLTNPDRLALVGIRSLKVVRRVRLAESPRHLRLERPGGPVLVPAEHANLLIRVALPGGAQRLTRVGRFPHDAVAAAGRVFVGNELGDRVSVLDGERHVASLDAPVQPGGLAVTGDDRFLAVVGVRGRALRLFDTRNLKRLGDVNVGIGPTHVVAMGRRFFVVDTRGNGLLEVRLRDGKPVVHRRIQLSGTPYGVAVDLRRRRIWVTLTGRNRVVELTDRHALRSFPTVRQPNSVAVDRRSGRVFVASRADGTLQVIDPPPYRAR